MIQYLLFGTSKLLNISDTTKRIGNFFKLPIQLSWGIAYPELALLTMPLFKVDSIYKTFGESVNQGVSSTGGDIGVTF